MKWNGLIITLLLTASCATIMPRKTIPPYIQDGPREQRKIYLKTSEYIRQTIQSQSPLALSEYTALDTMIYDEAHKHLMIGFNPAFAFNPLREKEVNQFIEGWHRSTHDKYRSWNVEFKSIRFPIQQLVPNIYRSSKDHWDRKRMPDADTVAHTLVTPLDRPFEISNGLNRRHIAMWNSHGWYFENKLHRWEWQRARVYTIVEDIFPTAFVLPYIAPMLENAGANVFLPRERDLQLNEVIVDNDACSTIASTYREFTRTGQWQTDSSGFAVFDTLWDGSNPFENGTSRQIELSADNSVSVEYIPYIPEDGTYGVTVSWPRSSNNTANAVYSVYHSGGVTRFKVDQSMGGSTWIWLGSFYFNKGMNAANGKVVLSSEDSTGVLAADAVRFGGGMGNIAREGQVSGYPRYEEAARYYLQYAGFPDTLVWDLNEGLKDYNDDYQCRGEWVNYLKGAPFGPNRNRDTTGLSIPVDLSLAFHTDAGATRNDTVVGTLMIYSIPDAKNSLVFPDGMSRVTARDLGDIVQTQITDDIRAVWDPAWNRRPMWNRYYSEAYRPNVPAILLELLSHHNYLDMKFGLDPRFRFDVSRSIYKGMLKYMAAQYGFEPVVQPLPPTHFSALRNDTGGISLSWQEALDSLEMSATANGFIIYMAKDQDGFNNGQKVSSSKISLNHLQKDQLYRFKVSAYNAGGESFPTEELAVYLSSSNDTTVLIVNGFDRIAPPLGIETGDFLAFGMQWDEGVPYMREMAHVGDQYDWLADSPWLDDDAPGHGASYADEETQPLTGNTFDYPARHGRSIAAGGYSFVSMSDEAFSETYSDLSAYPVVDLILGEERTTKAHRDSYPVMFTAFPPEMQRAITELRQYGTAFFISGAYVGTDLCSSRPKEHPDLAFAKNILKLKFRTNWASHSGELKSVADTVLHFPKDLSFNVERRSDIYTVEAPDGIEAADSTAMTVLRYRENNISAGIATIKGPKLVIFGFPFESISNTGCRDQTMQTILHYLLKKNRNDLPVKQSQLPKNGTKPY